VAQELVWLSSHPTYTGNDLEPRHVDLRAFVYLRGTGPGEVELADLALTRVAPHGGELVARRGRQGYLDPRRRQRRGWAVRDPAPERAVGRAEVATCAAW